jgi:hypothetical protein
VSYDDILVVKVRTPDFALVLAARSKHASGWEIVWTSHDFADEAQLSRGNHVLNAWNVVKHLTHLVISYSSLLDVAHREIKNSPNIPMEEDFKLT